MRYRSRSFQCTRSAACIALALGRSLPNGFSTTMRVQPGGLSLLPERCTALATER